MKQHHIIRLVFLSCISLLFGVYYTKIFSVSLAVSNSVWFSLVIVASTGNIFTWGQSTWSINTWNINTWSTNINGSSSSPYVKDKIQIDTWSVFTWWHGSATWSIDTWINNIDDGVGIDTGVASWIQVVKIRKKTIKSTIKKPDLLESLWSCKVDNEYLPKIIPKSSIFSTDICKSEYSKFTEYFIYREYSIINSIVYNHFFGYRDMFVKNTMFDNQDLLAKKDKKDFMLLKTNNTSIMISRDFWKFLDKLILFIIELF